jgi:hypothetical protein
MKSDLRQPYHFLWQFVSWTHSTGAMPAGNTAKADSTLRLYQPMAAFSTVFQITLFPGRDNS